MFEPIVWGVGSHHYDLFVATSAWSDDSNWNTGDGGQLTMAKGVSEVW